MTTKMIIKNQDGATIVEFAIIAPLLFLLIFGIIEFSLLLFNKHVITNSSREGARAGIVARENRFVDSSGNLTDDIQWDGKTVDSTVNDWIANHLVTFGGTGVPHVDINIVNDDPSIPGPPLCDQYTEFYALNNNFYSECVESVPCVPCLGYRCCLKITVSYDYHFLVFPNLMELIRGNITDKITLQAETVMLME